MNKQATLPQSGAAKLWSASYFFAFTASAVILALPMLVYGPMRQGHDSYEHLNFTYHFSEQFWKGELYPRWLLDMNHGLGSPSLFVYPPLPSFVVALLRPLETVLHFSAYNVGAFLALFVSGICAFLWLGSMVGRRIAWIGSVLYMLAPYHLAVDYYRRTALSECWALAWAPLVLYFCAEIMKRSYLPIVGLALAFALLILSHLVSVVIFCLIPFAESMLLGKSGERMKAVIRIGAGMLLGTGLACFYFISALAHAKYFPVSRLPLWHQVPQQLISTHTLIHPGSTASENFIHLVSVAVASMVLVSLLSLISLLLWGSRIAMSRTWFWAVICFPALMLMHSRSFWIWQRFPPLLAAIQYPWRLSIVLCIASTASAVTLLSEMSRLPRFPRASIVFVLFMISAFWFGLYTRVWRDYPTQADRTFSPVDEDDGWFAAWSVPGLDQTRALLASRETKARVLAGDGSVNVLSWQPRRIEIVTNSPTAARVVVNQFYYPAWRAILAGQSRPLQLDASMPEGLVSVYVPPGQQEVSIEMPLERSEQIGRWISGLSVLLACVLMWSSREVADDQLERAFLERQTES